MKNKEILIVKMSSLGDILQAINLVNYIKEKDPDIKLTWLVEQKHYSLLKTFPQIDHILSFDTSIFKINFFKGLCKAFQFRKKVRTKEYDVVFDLQGNTKSALMTLFAKSQSKVGFSWSSVAEICNLLVTNKKVFVSKKDPITKQYQDVIKTFFSEDENQKKPIREIPKQIFGKVMVCPGSAWENKQLDPNVFKVFLEKIFKKYQFKFLFVFGNEKEEKLCYALADFGLKDHEIKGPFAWNEWKEEIKHCDIIISADSCALHLASCMNAPTFSFFGPSSMKVYMPDGEIHAGTQGLCPYHITFEKRCPKLRTCKSGACIKKIDADHLFLAFEKHYDALFLKAHQAIKINMSFNK
jgi:heptosyltransferase-1